MLEKKITLEEYYKFLEEKFPVTRYIITRYIIT